MFREKALGLKDYKEKAVLTDCWATWCGPCIAEAEILQDVQRKARLSGQPVQLAGFLLGQNKAALLQYPQNNPSGYPMAMAISQSSSPFGDLLLISQKFLVDENGILVEKVTGRMERRDLDTLIAKYANRRHRKTVDQRLLPLKMQSSHQASAKQRRKQ